MKWGRKNNPSGRRSSFLRVLALAVGMNKIKVERRHAKQRYHRKNYQTDYRVIHHAHPVSRPKAERLFIPFAGATAINTTGSLREQCFT
jgi:hypothetical protein